MANIDKGFSVEILSLNDRTLITSGVGDPRIAGYEAPEGSLFAYKNGSSSTLLVKNGPADTDWTSVIGVAATSHTALTGRDAADQHPISAITNLSTILDTKVDIAGDVMTGSLGLPGTKGKGLLIGQEYSWVDLIGPIVPKTLGTSAAVLQPFYGVTTSWAHNAGAKGELTYHLPHDYAPGTDTFIHVHWGHNGTNITGSFVVKFWISISQRTYPATTFTAPVQTTLTVTGVNMTNTPRWGHRVDEIPLSTPGGSLVTIPTEFIETDGIINIHYEIDTIPSITGSDVVNVPYIQTIDIHMQSTTIGTKNKDPNFWS